MSAEIPEQICSFYITETIIIHFLLYNLPIEIAEYCISTCCASEINIQFWKSIPVQIKEFINLPVCSFFRIFYLRIGFDII